MRFMNLAYFKRPVNLPCPHPRQALHSPTRTWVFIFADIRGASEERSKAYAAYAARAPEPATKEIGKYEHPS